MPSRQLMSMPPVPVLRDTRVRLVLTSASLLFVELMLIRWIPSTVRYIGFFTNFLLMASFLGIGLGILIGRSGRRLPLSPFAPLLYLTVVLVLSAQLNVQVRSTDEIFFGLAESQAADTNYLVLPLVFLVVTALMTSLALPLGPLLRSRPPLEAYALDITGSLIGIASFTILSALQTPPVVWFSVVALLLSAAALGMGLSRWALVSGAAMLCVLAFTLLQSTVGIWSPYYRITTADLPGHFEIYVDGIQHQGVMAAGRTLPHYEQVYKWFPGRTYDQVLVVGAGSGTDVAVALQHGAGHVDAVEIDPAILQIGRDHNWAKPYQDPRVTEIVNDGRAFLRTTDRRYDLVVFALPDSLTLVSSTANVRLESFLFTQEAFDSVRDHLAPNGAFVVYNYYRDPWLISKIGSMLTTSFGIEPVVKTTNDNQATFATGPAVAALHGSPPPGDTVTALPAIDPSTTTASTDDWPFLYLRNPTIQPHYLLALAFVLLVAVMGVGLGAKATRAPLRAFSPHFFVLGSAFMLLETRSLVSFSLLFGTTWLVNSLAFFAILASVLIAIVLNARFRVRRSGPLYAALFVALAVAYVIPPERLIVDPPWLRYGLAAVLAFTPVFLANFVFTYSFRDTRVADMAFASNLIGAVVGGIIEYLAMITGYRFLLLVVAGLYGLAWLFANRLRFLADVQLERESPESSAVAQPELAL